MLYLLNFLRKLNIRNNEKGGTTLSLFFSTISGALFLFTFYNLTEYTAARSSAEQAARRVARCLSPSDPLCKQTLAEGVVGNPNANWYGYQPSFGPTSISVNTFRYSGEVREEVYSAEYNSFEVQTAQHEVIWDEVEVKPQRFVGLLNSYANLRADITIYVKPILGGSEKACRLTNVVNLPAGIDFSSATYFDTRWCTGFLEGGALGPRSQIVSARGCEDVGSGAWTLSPGLDRSNSYCELTIPKPRTDGDLPWLLLGGAPVCDDSQSAPSENIAQSVQELNQQFKQKGFKDPEPGDTQLRPFPITPSRQFLVVEAFSCNADSFLNNLNSQVKSSSSLKKYFKSSSALTLPRIDTLPPHLKQDYVSDLSDRTDLNSFIFQGLSDVGFIGEEDWTYFEWSRQADGLRHLSREVCQWLPWEEAVKKWPELAAQYDTVSGLRYRDTANGRKFYQSGNIYSPEVESLKFAQAPTCLSPKKSEIQPYTCSNREILGQAENLQDCLGWSQQKVAIESKYKQNSDFAIKLNSNQAWRPFEDLPLDFSFEISPRYSSALINKGWEFSWSEKQFKGKDIFVPTSVRARGAQNPKILPEKYQIHQLKYNDNQISDVSRENLVKNVALYEEAVSLEGWSDLVQSLKYIKISESPLIIDGVWPFIADTAGNSVAQVRPYIANTSTNAPFDYDLNCEPENSCKEDPQFLSIEEALRYYGSKAPSLVGKGDLRDPSTEFKFIEESAGTLILSLEQARVFPHCTAFSTTCGAGAVGNPIDLGANTSIPSECLNGTYVNCYPDYKEGQIGQQGYGVNTDYQMVKAQALKEITNLLPQARLCEDLNQPNCVKIDIQEKDGNVNVEVLFLAPLTYPLNSMLGSETLLVRGLSTELLETSRIH